MIRIRERLQQKLQRVDIQVSIFLAIIVLVSSLSVYAIGYAITYNDMIDSLKIRVKNIHAYLEDEIDPRSFIEINNKEDMDKPLYKNAKIMLEKLRNVTGVMYLYTAKATPDGKFVYVIDGLSEDEDFRYPGDPIEPEIHSAMNRSLAGETILPEDIKKTSWGKIFITYFPFHDAQGNIVGVLGIEIAADSHYDTYRLLRMALPVCIIVFCIISFFIASILFRRISNPSKQDLVNTDQLTKLKSRNAFEVDLNNMRASNVAHTAFIVIDLDNLKKVNDILGHGKGDIYITQSAQALRKSMNKGFIAYRTGGDEFAVIISKATPEIVEKYIADIRLNFDAVKQSLNDVSINLSIGWAIFDDKLDKTIFDTYDRADAKMYEQKNLHRKTTLN